MEDIYEKELSKAKLGFSSTKIDRPNNANSKLWHRELKNLPFFDQHQSDEVIGEEIKELPNNIKAEKFAEISQEYLAIKVKLSYRIFSKSLIRT